MELDILNEKIEAIRVGDPEFGVGKWYRTAQNGILSITAVTMSGTDNVWFKIVDTWNKERKENIIYINAMFCSKIIVSIDEGGGPHGTSEIPR